MLLNPILFLAFVLLVGFFVWPHDAPAVFYALQTVMFTFICPLSEFVSLDEGIFGCLLDDMPYAVDLD
jgi:hypothetical protein